MPGRLTFLAAAELSTDVLFERAGFTRRAAEYYRDRLQPPPSSSTPRQIMSQLNRQQRSRGPKSK
jgi:hypothetical protein